MRFLIFAFAPLLFTASISFANPATLPTTAPSASLDPMIDEVAKQILLIYRLGNPNESTNSQRNSVSLERMSQIESIVGQPVGAVGTIMVHVNDVTGKPGDAQLIVTGTSKFETTIPLTDDQESRIQKITVTMEESISRLRETHQSLVEADKRTKNPRPLSNVKDQEVVVRRKAESDIARVRRESETCIQKSVTINADPRLVSHWLRGETREIKVKLISFDALPVLLPTSTSTRYPNIEVLKSDKGLAERTKLEVVIAVEAAP